MQSKVTLSAYLELPLLLPSQVKHETEQLLAACLQKTTGADLRATAIVLRQFLTGKVSNEIHTLLDTFVCIAQAHTTDSAAAVQPYLVSP